MATLEIVPHVHLPFYAICPDVWMRPTVSQGKTQFSPSKVWLSRASPLLRRSNRLAHLQHYPKVRFYRHIVDCLTAARAKKASGQNRFRKGMIDGNYA
jgi:hypothetical protein